MTGDELSPWSRHVLDVIVFAAGEVTGVTEAEIRGRGRQARVAYARFLAYWTARQAGTWSLPVLGRYFGRHHSTVLHGVREVERRLLAGSAEVLDDTDQMLDTLFAVTEPEDPESRTPATPSTPTEPDTGDTLTESRTPATGSFPLLQSGDVLEVETNLAGDVFDFRITSNRSPL